MKTIVGIDVSKKTATVAVTVERQVIEEFVITLDLIGFNSLLAHTSIFEAPLFIFEATGMYSRRVEAFMVSHNFAYQCLNPLAARKRMDSDIRFEKTDKIDARQLALTQYDIHKSLTEYKQNPIYRELLDMDRYYVQLNEDIKRAKNRVHRLLQLTFASYTDEFNLGSSLFNWHILAEFPHPEFVLNKSISEIRSVIQGLTNKGIGHVRAERTATKLWHVAGVTATAVNASSDVVRQMVVQTLTVIRLQVEKDAQIARMIALGENLPELTIIQSIPGIGQATAIRIIAELGDIRRFSNANKINRFIGIDLPRIQSGDYEKHGHIQKRGNPRARQLLYWAIMTINNASKKNPTHIHDIYQKRQQLHPSRKKKPIIVLCMDRLLRTIHYLVNTNQYYSYELATRQ